MPAKPSLADKLRALGVRPAADLAPAPAKPAVSSASIDTVVDGHFVLTRRGDLETAVRLWEQAAGQGHVYAHVELAKYYEHHLRDFAVALEWTRKAVERVGVLDIPRCEYNHWMQELEHRRERLQSKQRL